MISLVRLSNKTWTMQICTHQFWYCYFRWFHVYQLMRPKIVTAIISVYRNATTNWTNQIYCESSMIIINNQKDGNSLIHCWELWKQPRITENNHTKSITLENVCQEKKALAWLRRQDRLHLPTLRYEDGQFGFVVGARGNVLRGIKNL